MKKNIVIVSIIIVICVIAIVGIKAFKESKSFVYHRAEAVSDAKEVLIEDYKTLTKIIKKNSVDEIMSNAFTFKKNNIKEYFNEEYFENKNVALISLYQDTSKESIVTIDKVTYNSDKSEVTIEYTYKRDGYGGHLTSQWFDYLFVEVEKTVAKVNFVKNNS